MNVKTSKYRFMGGFKGVKKAQDGSTKPFWLLKFEVPCESNFKDPSFAAFGFDCAVCGVEQEVFNDFVSHAQPGKSYDLFLNKGFHGYYSLIAYEL